MGQLVLLEYALPLRPYKHLSIPWPRREDYSDLGERLYDQIRPKYLQRGSLSLIGYLIERFMMGFHEQNVRLPRPKFLHLIAFHMTVSAYCLA